MVDPNGDDGILEMKHSASALIVFKTRGTFTVEPGGPMPKPIIARAGHRLETPVSDEPAEWERVFRARDYQYEDAAQAVHQRARSSGTRMPISLKCLA